MLYFSLITIMLIFGYLFKKQREIIKYLPVSHKGVINLYEKMKSNKSYVSIYKLYFNLFVLMALIVMMAITLKLNLMFTLSLLIITLLLMPLIISWQLNYYRQEYDFNNLTTYINQFVMVFKSYPKIYATLIEIENTISGDLRRLVNDSIESIKSGQGSFEALASITKVYPHFIVYNLHALTHSIEQYGTDDYFEALDLIQDDLDDWVEDMAAYKYAKNRIITKVSILILFAFVICFVALKMLFSVKVSSGSTLYQVSMFIFCLLQIFTYVISCSLLNADWIERSEVIC